MDHDVVRVLAVAGSLRKDSYNRRLIRIGAEMLRQAGAEVDLLDLAEVPLPPYDGDVEESAGLPPGAVEFKRRLGLAQGFLIASPEYNSSIPGTFKNAIDWASRGEDDVFEDKVAALMAASPGAFGGARMMPHLRQVLTTLGVWLLPTQLTIPKAGQAFASDGSLVSPPTAERVKSLAEQLVLEIRRRARAAS